MKKIIVYSLMGKDELIFSTGLKGGSVCKIQVRESSFVYECDRHE
jgi:hypothetical protein